MVTCRPHFPTSDITLHILCVEQFYTFSFCVKQLCTLSLHFSRRLLAAHARSSSLLCTTLHQPAKESVELVRILFFSDIYVAFGKLQLSYSFCQPYPIFNSLTMPISCRFWAWFMLIYVIFSRTVNTYCEHCSLRVNSVALNLAVCIGQSLVW